MKQETMNAQLNAADAAPSRPRRAWQEIGATVVLMSAIGALGYVLVSERHSRQVDHLRTTWSTRIRDIEARAFAAEETAGKLSLQAQRLSAELPALQAAREALEQQLAATTATLASDRAQAHRELSLVEDMNATLRRELEVLLDEYTQALVDSERDLKQLTAERDSALAEAHRLGAELEESAAAYAKAESEAGEIVARLVAAFPTLAESYARVPSEPEADAPAPALTEQAPVPPEETTSEPRSATWEAAHDGLLPLIRDISTRTWTEWLGPYLAEKLPGGAVSSEVSMSHSPMPVGPAEQF